MAIAFAKILTDQYHPRGALCARPASDEVRLMNETSPNLEPSISNVPPSATSEAAGTISQVEHSISESPVMRRPTRKKKAGPTADESPGRLTPARARAPASRVKMERRLASKKG